MSDPVTNVEIEDVLSSIRKLVSEGDKARTRDPSPAEAVAPAAPSDAAPDARAADETARPEKLVLTPAFLVVDGDAALDEEAPAEAPADDEASPMDHAAAEELSADTSSEAYTAPDSDAADADAPQPDEARASEAEPETDETAPSQPLTLNNRIDTAPEVEQPATTDRSELVATIAELEAAVNGTEEDFEPDGSEVISAQMGWPSEQDAPVQDDTAQDTAEHTPQADAADEALPDGGDDAPFAFAPSPEEADEPGPVADSEAESDEAQDDDLLVSDDDDLDGLLSVGGVALDEEALRELVGQVVREELTGPMGERITRNVRKLVRREIYRILSSQEFD